MTILKQWGWSSTGNYVDEIGCIRTRRTGRWRGIHSHWTRSLRFKMLSEGGIKSVRCEGILLNDGRRDTCRSKTVFARV